MKCPHCDKEIPGVPCPRCGETVFENANYCMACGAPLKEGLQHVSHDEDVMEDDSELDLENRILCPDGSCTGIIIDGKCSECGRLVGADGKFIEQAKGRAVEENSSYDETETKKAD
jgi:hypothetical protein